MFDFVILDTENRTYIELLYILSYLIVKFYSILKIIELNKFHEVNHFRKLHNEKGDKSYENVPLAIQESGHLHNIYLVCCRGNLTKLTKL